MKRIKNGASILLVCILLVNFFIEVPNAHASGTSIVTNGSTQIGSFPSALPNNSFRINTGTVNSASVSSIAAGFLGPSSATLSTTTGWTQVQNGSADDASKEISFGFNTTFNGTAYPSVYIGSNTYLTFGSGSSLYSSLSANRPAIPGVHVCSADNSYQKVFHKLDSVGVMRVRYEGTASTSGTVGSPNIIYEAVFYSGQSYFDIHVGTHARCGGDTTAPTITSISSDKPNGSYKAGDIIDIDVYFSEIVTSTGSVTVTLETGTIDRTCTFTVSASTMGTCNYVVQAGDTSADLNVNSVSGVIRDTSNNQMVNFTPGTNLAVNKNIIIDTTAPVVSNVTSSLANGSYKSGQLVPIQVVFNETVTVTGTPQLVLVTGSPATTTLSYTSGSGSNTLVFNYTVASSNFSSDLDYGSATALSLNGGLVRDIAGNNAVLTLPVPGASGSLSANKAIVIDNTIPSVLLTSTAPSLTHTGIPVAVTFSEPVVNFVVDDISVTNGTAGSFSGSGSNYTFTVNPSVSGSVAISLASGIATDLAGNENSASNTITRVVDMVAPIVAITTLVSSPTLQTPIPFTISFSEEVTGFTLSDLLVVNATAGNFMAVGPTSYSVDISPVGHPTLNVDVEVSLPAGRVFDMAGNGNSASDSGVPATIRFDNHSPTVSLASGVSDPTNTSVINVNVVFSESVTGFDSNDILVTNGVISNFSGSGTTYTFEITPNAEGVVSAYIPADSAEDPASNLNLVSNIFSRQYDATAPTVILSSVMDSVVSDSRISVTATFSENVTGFSVGDITVTNGTVTNFTGAGSVYTFDIMASDQGVVSAYISASSVLDYAGNGNILSDTFSRVYDSLGPVLTEVAHITESTTDNTPDYTFNTTEAGSISYGGSCVSSSTVAEIGDVTVTFEELAVGSYNDCTITVTDAVSNVSNILVLSAFTILDNTPPSIVSVTSEKEDGIYGVGEVIDIIVTFSKEVTSVGEVTVTLETGDVDRACTFTVTNNITGSCNYVVQPGDVSLDLDVVSISGSVADQALLEMVDFTPESTLSSSKALVIDGVAPTNPGIPTASTPTNDTTPTWTWTASTDALAGLSATPYIISWSEDEAFLGTVFSATSVSATYTHSTALADGRWYLRVIAVDSLGNESESVSGSVVIDTVAPMVLSFSPTDNAISVNIASPLVVTFSEPMQISSGFVSIYKTESNSLVEAISITSDQVAGVGTDTITITPANNFTGGTAYYILVQATALDDLAGNSYSGIASSTTWNFVTADTTAPVISGMQVSAQASSATISWVTDEDASSKIEYGFGNGFEFTTGEMNTDPRVMNHFVALSNLQSCRQYVYRVISRDSLLNESIASAGSFKTSGCGAVPVAVLQKINENLQAEQQAQLAMMPNPTTKTETLSANSRVSVSVFTKDARRGSTHNEVSEIQQFLKEEGVYPEGIISGFFGSLTKEAVIRFQEKYASEILAPVRLTKGTGIVGPYTRIKMNEILSNR